MAAVRLDVWLEKFPRPVGCLETDSDGSLCFAYDKAYLGDTAAFPVSLSLPLHDEAYGDAVARAFFGNLLPENDQLDQLLAREGLERRDIAGILHHLGADLSGALSCLPAGSPPVKVPGDIDADYLALSAEQLEELVKRLGTHRPLPDEVRDPSPVAGIQRKIALTEIGRGFAIPRAGSGAPTTHILKVPAADFRREAFYEARSARLGRDAGLDVAPSRSQWIAGFEVLIATRFDRRIDSGRIYRVHQEDFAQALALPARLKYERDGSAARSFNAAAIARLLSATDVPAEAALTFLRASFFNLAIGNTDNHAKNHALLYEGGAAPRIAPLYDLVPIRLSDQHHHLFSFRIGAADRLETLTAEDLLAFLATFGLTGGRATRFLQREVVPLVAPLRERPEPESDWGAAQDRQLAADVGRLLGIVDAASTAAAPKVKEKNG
jgi:serine/threonine-protein kinase HipA